ncbi:hypothetical protein JOE49_004892 [Paenibacillus sp. PvR133]|uniref:hypothetical protein n=1 Tax=Paenibacillus sp. PvR133 TaxID=2806598 RepID=UPI001AE6E691|nr:hypothetical protein [Paenibacillus sp. PvR133]MBP1177640.1 hypothetical protein [Paenibacillus sp. PvR133]
MNRASNDATLTKLGDIYQHYIGLLECFKMEVEETITFELTGDITKISKNNSFQMEVKHHVNKSSLIDRNIDFWKTLRNWLKEFERLTDIKRLILFTTSEIDSTSSLYKWNEKREDERLTILKKIGDSIKSRENTFRTLYNDVFLKENYNEHNLRSILSRLEIMSRQQQINNIDNEFGKYIPHVPEENRENFIAYLLGVIVTQVKNPPHIWEVKYSDFVALLREATPSFVQKDTVPLLTEYMHLPLPVEVEEENQNKVFVREIKRIKYDKQIPLAISDLWKCNMTVNKHYIDNLIFNKGISEYRVNLHEKLNYTKDLYIIDNEDSDRNTQIKESKKFYSEVMSWNAIPFGSINPNQPFFQKGVVHDIVENDGFTWDVGDEN